MILGYLTLFPLVSGFLLGNLLLRRRTALPRLKYWSIAVTEFALPMVVAVLVGVLGHHDPLVIF